MYLHINIFSDEWANIHVPWYTGSFQVWCNILGLVLMLLLPAIDDKSNTPNWNQWHWHEHHQEHGTWIDPLCDKPIHWKQTMIFYHDNSHINWLILQPKPTWQGLQRQHHVTLHVKMIYIPYTAVKQLFWLNGNSQ